MNIAGTLGMNQQASPNRVQMGRESSGTFGSVFGSIAARSSAAIAPVQQQPVSQISEESIQSIFNASSVEELEAALKGVVSDEANDLTSISSLGDLEPKQVIESVLSFLEKAGLNEDELSTIANTNDFWTILSAIDKVAHQFFNQLTDALEGKGDIPKQQAVELLALLKAAELIAPKTDLLLKQELQVFSLQSYLTATSEQFESTVNAVKQGMAQLMDSRHAVRFVSQSDTGQAMTDDGTKEKGSEVAQLAVNSASGNFAVAKGELSTTELENRNNARNETLSREMQNIFKRSNFGQTGGTNRLLVKLYPEHLGQVRIELLQVNGIMTARILASTALGKEMLDSQLNQLRSAFLQQNLQVERIDVSQTLQDTSRNDREQAFNQHLNKEGQETADQKEQNDEEEMTFQEFMIDLEV